MPKLKLTSFPRETWLNKAEFPDGRIGYIIDQSPGMQTIFFRNYSKYEEARKANRYSSYTSEQFVETYQLFMPWSRFLVMMPNVYEDNRLSRYDLGKRWLQFFNGCDYDRWDGHVPVGAYLNPLPTSLGFSSCSAGNSTLLDDGSPEEIANSVVLQWWGSTFSVHVSYPNTWKHPFWMSFGIAEKSTQDEKHPYGAVPDPYQVYKNVAAVLETWQNTSPEKIMDLSLGEKYDMTGVVHGAY